MQRFRNKRAERFQDRPCIVFFVLSSCFCAVFADAAGEMLESAGEVCRTETVPAR
jgi:hypothetical protein